MTASESVTAKHLQFITVKPLQVSGGQLSQPPCILRGHRQVHQASTRLPEEEGRDLAAGAAFATSSFPRSLGTLGLRRRLPGEPRRRGGVGLRRSCCPARRAPLTGDGDLQRMHMLCCLS